MSSAEAEQTGGENGTQKDGMRTPQACRQILENTPALFGESRLLFHKGKTGKNARPAAQMEGVAFQPVGFPSPQAPGGRGRVSSVRWGFSLPFSSPRARPPELAGEPRLCLRDEGRDVK